LEYIFGAIGLLILAIVVLIIPVGIHFKGKILLIMLISVMSILGLMASTFLPFWQISGLLLLLVVCFTFLLSRSPEGLFLKLQTDNMMGDVEQTRLTLPVRMKDVSEHIDSSNFYKHTASLQEQLKETAVDNLKDFSILADQQDTEKFSSKELAEETTDYHNEVKNDQIELNRSQPPQESNSVSIEQDLHHLMNRYIVEDEVEKSKPIHSFYNDSEEETSFVRDLEALLEGNEQPHSINDTNKNRKSKQKTSQLFDENVIEELQLTPVEKKENFLDEESFSPFEVIDEIKSFSSTKKDDQKDNRE
jgi:hypothetical protein